MFESNLLEGGSIQILPFGERVGAAEYAAELGALA